MKAVIDSCVIFGMPLCDTLLRAAEANLYQIVLSQKILEDATRNMVLKGRLKPEKEAYYQQQIKNAFPDNFFDAPSEIVAAMTNADTDRHVAAIWSCIKFHSERLLLGQTLCYRERFTEE
jgi:hypothetical protein